jgi:F0F1-type ATP synthase assembly protein I
MYEDKLHAQILFLSSRHVKAPNNIKNYSELLNFLVPFLSSWLPNCLSNTFVILFLDMYENKLHAQILFLSSRHVKAPKNIKIYSELLNFHVPFLSPWLPNCLSTTFVILFLDMYEDKLHAQILFLSSRHVKAPKNIKNYSELLNFCVPFLSFWLHNCLSTTFVILFLDMYEDKLHAQILFLSSCHVKAPKNIKNYSELLNFLVPFLSSWLPNCLSNTFVILFLDMYENKLHAQILFLSSRHVKAPKNIKNYSELLNFHVPFLSPWLPNCLSTTFVILFLDIYEDKLHA